MKYTLTLIMLLSFSAAFSQRIEAENYTAMSGIQKEVTTDVSAGYDVGFIDNGDWTEYKISVKDSGTYTINFRVANLNNTPQVTVLSDNTPLTAFKVPATGGWQTFKTYSIKVKLKAGDQTLRMLFVKGGLNFNWFEITPPVSVPTALSISDLKTQIDSLTSQLNALKAQINSNVISFPPAYWSHTGSGTPTDPSIYIPIIK